MSSNHSIRIASPAKHKAGTGITRNALLLAIMLALAACESSFSQDDIDHVKQIIKAEFEKNDAIKVVEVHMIKESPKKLSGFVKLKVSSFGSQVEVMKSCSATMGEGSDYLWKCQ